MLKLDNAVFRLERTERRWNKKTKQSVEMLQQRHEPDLQRSWLMTFDQFLPSIVDKEAATDVVIQFKAGMNDPRRPLGVLLFCGPTGVGKTELAKSMSRFLFGASGGEISSSGVTSETATKPESPRMIRLDMSEYAGPWAADRLLMQSNGEPSDFLQQIRRQPFTVLLLDEIEKAHPSVYDVLMNVFDEGRKLKACYAGSWSTVTVVAIHNDKTLSGNWDCYPALTSRRTREDLTVARQDSDSIFEPG
jgi:ATP-dependent Clp protease ATP-binding subunit ClpC